MSNITFQCVSCGADFEVEMTAVIEKSKTIKCPNCDAKPAAGRVHSFALALEELISCMAGLRTKVRFEITLDTDDLPPPYGPAEEEGGLTAFEDEDLSSADEDDDDDDDDDEVDGDEDEDYYDDDDDDDDEDGDEEEEESEDY
jgi:DNA-directed RNA polymerase subunit RPC12/RpoP